MPLVKLTHNLRKHIDLETYNNFFSRPYQYSLFPAGKMFRPLIVWSSAMDFNRSFSTDCELLASFTEIHHTYTLIHDDMPCMDDDDIRRGRNSTHKEFGQWQALLSGDGLLNASYALLSRIQSKNLNLILRYTTWALGPKGLILGQAMDLSGKMTESFNDLILTHKLKTARLIQVSLVTPILAEQGLKNKRLIKDLHRLGEHMGIAFQLLDDLCELTDEELSEHEGLVNPWPRFNSKCFKKLETALNYTLVFFENEKSQNLKNTYSTYLKKIKTQLSGSESIIENHIGSSLMPIMNTLNRLSS